MKDKILSILFLSIIGFVFLINIFVTDKELSYTERRHLAKLPEVSVEKILSGGTMKGFDSYALDQFVLRDELRALKAKVNLNLFKKTDNNDIYIKNNMIYKYEFPLKEDKVINFTNKINNLYDTYLKDLNVYYSIIPDKNYFLDDNLLKMDYDKLVKLVNENIKEIKYIDIFPYLDINDYYFTDTHWRQEKIVDVASFISKELGFNITDQFSKHNFYPFYGVLYGQAAIKNKADTLTYLTNKYIDSAKVKDYESNLTSVYELSSLGKMDSYDVFLSGATPLVEIKNTRTATKKELIIFRDSFSSSIAPLFLEGYSKITLVDLRYMPSKILKDYIEFKNQDVLILYSTLVINSSDILK